MSSRQPIAEGYLDEVFARRAVETEATATRSTAQQQDAAAGRQRRRKRRPAPRKQGTAKRRAGVAESRWGEASISLDGRQVDFVDSVVRALRASGARGVTRQQVVRVLVDALDRASLDLSRVDSLEALGRAVRDRLQSPSLLRASQAAIEVPLRLLGPLADGVLGLLRGSTGRR